MAAIFKIPLVILLFLFLLEQSNAQQALSPIFAPQLKALQQNKDISWIGEGQVDFRLVPHYCVDTFENNSVRILKMTSIDSMRSIYNPYEFEPCEWIIERMIDDIANEKYLCFNDEELTQTLKNEKIVDFLFPADTAICCFCDDDEDGIKLVRRWTRPDETPFIRSKFLLYYNEKTGQFGNINLAFAPLMIKKDAKGNISRYHPMLWALFPNDNSSQKTIFKNNDFPYFIQTVTQNNSPKTANFITLKGHLDLKKIVYEDIKNPEKCINNETFKPETYENLQRLTSKTDTIETWNDDSNEMVKSPVPSHIEERLLHIRLVHLWYYDSKKQQLYCRLSTTCPMFDKLDDEGNFRYSLPLYYREAEQVRRKKKIKKTHR
jgi:hypothetical protein